MLSFNFFLVFVRLLTVVKVHLVSPVLTGFVHWIIWTMPTTFPQWTISSLSLMDSKTPLDPKWTSSFSNKRIIKWSLSPASTSWTPSVSARTAWCVPPSRTGEWRPAGLARWSSTISSVRSASLAVKVEQQESIIINSFANQICYATYTKISFIHFKEEYHW